MRAQPVCLDIAWHVPTCFQIVCVITVDQHLLQGAQCNLIHTVDTPEQLKNQAENAPLLQYINSVQMHGKPCRASGTDYCHIILILSHWYT